ncbi:hypothetical protein O5629_27735, partial [Escherichia coli]|nr:hypothetical protein [Escherichia coli]
MGTNAWENAPSAKTQFAGHPFGTTVTAETLRNTFAPLSQGKNPRLRNDFLRCAIGVSEQRGW